MNIYFTKENIQRANKKQKDALGKSELKPQRDPTTQLLEWLKLKRLIIPSVGKDMEELELPYTVGRNVKWCNHFVKQFGSFIKS